MPTTEGKEFLIALAQELGKLPNKISIEGHTDSKPFAKTGNYGNWELSADRANAARQIDAAERHCAGPGDADSWLRGSTASQEGHPGTPSNRGITVIVQYTGNNDDTNVAESEAGKSSEPPNQPEAPKNREAEKPLEH